MSNENHKERARKIWNTVPGESEESPKWDAAKMEIECAVIALEKGETESCRLLSIKYLENAINALRRDA